MLQRANRMSDSHVNLTLYFFSYYSRRFQPFAFVFFLSIAKNILFVFVVFLLFSLALLKISQLWAHRKGDIVLFLPLMEKTLWLGEKKKKSQELILSFTGSSKTLGNSGRTKKEKRKSWFTAKNTKWGSRRLCGLQINLSAFRGRTGFTGRSQAAMFLWGDSSPLFLFL